MSSVHLSVKPIGAGVLPVTTWNPRTDGGDDEFTYIDLSSVDQAAKTISATNHVTASEAPSRARQIVNAGDILVSTVRPNLNAVAQVPEHLHKATASTGFCVLRPDNQTLDGRYLFHWARSEAFIREMVQRATGANYPAVSDRIIKDSNIPAPTLDEQKRIAAILDKADAIRRKRQQAIELTDQFLRSVFLDLFGDISTRSAKKVLLGDVVTIDAPMVDPKLKEYLDLVHIGPDRIEKETGRLLPAMTAREEGLISNKFIFDDRYVLYSKIRPYLKKCALAVGRGLCSADMYPIRPNEDVMTREFLWMLLLSGPFDAFVASLPGRANIPKLNRTELSSFGFLLPDLHAQLKFSEVVKQTNAIKEKLGATADSPDTLFGALSEKAFAGKL